MTRTRSRNTLVAVFVAVVLAGGWLAAPGSAHNSSSIKHNWRRHYAPLARQVFYTKAGSDARFIDVGEQASDADLLDGLDSAAFAASSHAHSGDDITSGTVAEARIDALIARVADVVGIVLAADGAGSGLDADLLDGLSSGAFELDGLSQEVGWFKESADALATTTTSERVVFTAPDAITITDVFVEPAGAVAANDTNHGTIVVSRRDAGGGNRVTVASGTTQTAGSGGTGSWTAFATVSLGSLSNTSLAEGQKLTLEITKTGVGVALPVLVLQIEYTVD